MSSDNTSLCLDVTQSDTFTMYNGDSCQVIPSFPSDSIGYIIYSPSFESLYAYSDNLNCLSNCSTSEEFFEHYGYMVSELYRTLMPGRCCSVHLMQLPKTIQRDGVIGLRDFRGEIIRCHEKYGFIYHSEVCIWKNPVQAMQRSKALGLLHKQVLKDSAMSRQGIADYVVTFRKPGRNPRPIAGPFKRYPGSELPCDSYQYYIEDLNRFELGEISEEPDWQNYMGDNISIMIWQLLASPVWMDINQSRVLNNFRDATTDEQIKHLCPLQLDVIERCLMMWSMPGDLVLSPAGGIGSEGYCAIRMKREFVGIELHDSYYRVACQNLYRAEEENRQGLLFQ